MSEITVWLKSSAELFSQYGSFGLFIVAFAESSFFPIPPDLILIPLALLNPKLALVYALVTTIASVLGGIFGYGIGQIAGRPLLRKFISDEKMLKIEKMFENYGGWAVAIAGFTPIPYKVFTIASGVCRINKTTFVIASTLGRSGRFFLEGIIIMLLGDKAKYFLDRYLELGTIALTLLILGVYLLVTLFKKRSHVGQFAFKLKQKVQAVVQATQAPFGDFGNSLLTGIALAAVTLFLFSKLAKDLIYQELTVFDSSIIEFISQFKTPTLTLLMKSLTFFGSAATLAGIALLAVLILACRKKYFWSTLMVPVTLGGSWMLNEQLKIAFHRSRPTIARMVEVGGYSFPSGHAMIGATFYGFLAYLLWTNLPKSRARYFAVSGLMGLVVLIGISRIYLGVHYPSDVLAGFAAGGFWLTGCILALEAIKYYKADGLKK